MTRVPIGQVLKDRGLVDDAQLFIALTLHCAWAVPVGEVLVRLGLVREDQLLSALGQQSGAPVVHIGERTIAPEVLEVLPEELVRHHHVLPLRVSTRTRSRLLFLAMPYPSDRLLLDEIELAAGMPVVPALASPADIAQAIARHFGETG